MKTKGIHVVWTTYGVWPPGDSRGHWSPLFDMYGRLKLEGHRLNAGDLTTRRIARAKMTEPAKRLTLSERLLVARTIGEVLSTASLPSQSLKAICYAAAVEEDHVHLLLVLWGINLSTLIGRIKGDSASAVCALPANAGRKHIWTANFWRNFLFDDGALPKVRRYIVDHNRRRGLPDDPYGWVRPT